MAETTDATIQLLCLDERPTPVVPDKALCGDAVRDVPADVSTIRRSWPTYASQAL